jgi:hypothetical protein
MAWLISKSLVNHCANLRSSLGQAGESSADISLDGKPCALWNGTHTRRASWLPVKTTDACRLSQSGMTCKTLTDTHGEGLLTSFRAGFRARTFQPQERAQESTGPEAVCGGTWRELSVKFDPVTSSWRTRQDSLLVGLKEFSGTWPRWGMMRGGECWELPTPYGILETRKLIMIAKGFGSVLRLPTILKSDSGGGQGPGGSVARMNRGKYLQLSSMAIHNLWPDSDKHGELTPREHLNADWADWFMGWPIGWTNILKGCDAGLWATGAINWWAEEPINRSRVRQKNDCHRIACSGNGQVPICAALAWETLTANS